MRLFANALGILLASLIVPGFSFTGSFGTLLGAGLILALASSVVRPILKLLSLPLIIITLGLFLVVINMLVLKIVDYVLESLTIVGIGTLFWGTVVVSLVNGLTRALIREKKTS